MNFKERKPDFREADRKYAELARRRDSGAITDEEFDAERKRLMVLDKQGRWWAKSRKSGEWKYHDGKDWVPGVPPGYEQTAQPEGEPSPPPRTGRAEAQPDSPPSEGSADGSPVRERISVKRPRRRRRGFVMAAVVLAGAALVAVALFGWSGQGEAYALVENESGNLSVEAPSDWSEHVTEDLGGEKGRASWSSWIGLGDVGSSLTAVNALDGWRTGADGHQGMYMFASKELASYEHEYLAAAGPNDYWETCEGGEIQDFNRGEYSGKVLQWKNCGGESGHVAVTLSASPEDRECVVVMQIGGYFRTDADEEKIQHVLDTFEADCGSN